MRALDHLTKHDASKEREPARSYIGASIIGSKCQALLALSLRGFPNDDPDPQTLRIFREGHRVEVMVTKMLERIGLRLRTIDPDTGRQYNYTRLGGHLASNLDGLVWRKTDTPGVTSPAYTLEVKSMNRAKFDAFVKKGLGLSHPDYFDQVHFGMGMSEVHASIVLAYCKDNSKFHAEVIRYQPEHYQQLIQRAANAMYAPSALRTETWDCTRCFKRTACKGQVPNVPKDDLHCRHCRHSRPAAEVDGRRWRCSRHGIDDVAQPCGDFEFYQTKAKA